jgi:energy-coupling factor transport system substrate-specific component
VKELITMWKYNTMVALTLLTAGIYTLFLVPFKSITLIPGFTEIRPASLIPVLSGMLFGPAGVWGAALGNLIGDCFGTLSPASIFGFFGNFLYSYLAYKLWSVVGFRNTENKPPLINSARKLVHFGVISFTATAACAASIAWGTDILRLVPFTSLSTAIMLNNCTVNLILGPILLPLLYSRLKKKKLIWTDIMHKSDISRPNPDRLFPVRVF